MVVMMEGRGVRQMARFRTGAVAVAAGALVPAMAACTSSDATGPSAPELDADTSGTVVLGVTDDPVQQRLVDSYESEFAAVGRSVDASDVSGQDRLPRLLSGELTMVVGCVGELLDELDPAKGEEMRGRYAEAKDEAAADGGEVDPSQWRDITHSTMFSALPTDLQASDPGEAVGCDDDSLPQNIVALYRNTELDRQDRKALNNVAGGVSSDEVASEGEQGE